MSTRPTVAPSLRQPHGHRESQATAGTGNQNGLLGNLAEVATRVYPRVVSSRDLVQRVDQPRRSRTVGSHRMHLVHA